MSATPSPFDTPSPFATPEIVELPAQDLAVVRERVAFDAIPGLYDRAFPLIFATLARLELAPVAPPCGVIRGEPGAELDLGVAVPIAAPLPDADTGEVRSELLPGGRAATLLVRGEYDLLGAAYEHLYAWLAAAGETPSGVAWEQYLTEPTPDGDPAQNETLLAVHLS